MKHSDVVAWVVFVTVNTGASLYSLRGFEVLQPLSGTCSPPFLLKSV